MQDVLSFGAFDIYILDIIMPGCSGIQLGKDLRRADPDGKILHLTSSAEYALESCRVKAFDITSILDFFLGNTYIFMAVSRLILCPLVALAVWKWVRTSYMELQNHVQKGRYIFAAIALIFYILMSMAAILHSFIQYI